TDLATTRKRSPFPPSAVDVSHNPSAVASPSSLWKSQRKRAPSRAGWTDRPLPWYCAPALAPSSAKGMDALVGLDAGILCAAASTAMQIIRLNEVKPRHSARN